MNGDLEASVLIPTTGDRGDLLRYSVASVLRQTENRLEVLVVGDGMSSNSRRVVEEMARSDHRIRLFDFPKHENRGEPNRHQILLHEARGRNIFYLCDRNLLLPDHVERLGRLLKDADLAHGLMVAIRPDGQLAIKDYSGIFGFGVVPDLTRESQRRLTVKRGSVVPLSSWGHTLSFYRKLPRGWETPPAGWFSDQHMLAQFLAHPECKVVTTMVPTALNFQKLWRGHDAVTVWRHELPLWFEKLNEPDFPDQFREHAMERAIIEQQTQIDDQQIEIDQLAATIRFFHRHPLRYVLGKLKAKLKSRIKT
jgi:glycosyltransferase involved in cell wall biosynthesis